MVARATNTTTRHTKHSKVISSCNIVHYVGSCSNDISSMLMENQIWMFKRFQVNFMIDERFKVMLLQLKQNKKTIAYYMVLWECFLSAFYVLLWLGILRLVKRNPYYGLQWGFYRLFLQRDNQIQFWRRITLCSSSYLITYMIGWSTIFQN